RRAGGSERWGRTPCPMRPSYLMMGGSPEPYHCPCFLAPAKGRAGVIRHVPGLTPDGILDRGRRVGIREALDLQGLGCWVGSTVEQADMFGSVMRRWVWVVTISYPCPGRLGRSQPGQWPE